MDRYLNSTIEEFSEAIKGYWRNWERQRVWMTREIIYAMIQGNPNIENSKKPKREDIYKLSDDKKPEVKKVQKINAEQLERIKFNLMK